MAEEDGIVYGDWAAIVEGPASVEAAARGLLAPDSANPNAGDIDIEAVVAGYRVAVAAALPAGVSLRDEVFTGPADRPVAWASTIRAAVSSVGLPEVIAGVDSDAQAARLLRLALRRTERELARLRDAQRDNARRRHHAGVPKARIARDLGVQRVTVVAWLRRDEPTEPPTPPPPAESPPATPGPDTTAAAEHSNRKTTTATPSPTSRSSRPGRRRDRLTPVALRFDPDTVRMQRWPDHPGGWLVYADDVAGHPVLIGHLDRQDKLGGRVAGWQPLDQDRRRLATATVPKTRPAAVAELLRVHEQRGAATQRRPR